MTTCIPQLNWKFVKGDCPVSSSLYFIDSKKVVHCSLPSPLHPKQSPSLSNRELFFTIPIQSCGFYPSLSDLAFFYPSIFQSWIFSRLYPILRFFIPSYPILRFFLHPYPILRFFNSFLSNLAVFFPIHIQSCGFFIPSYPILRFFFSLPLQSCGLFYPFLSNLEDSLNHFLFETFDLEKKHTFVAISC